MTEVEFWILAAGLTGLALLFVVAPILRKPDATPGIDENQVNLTVFRRQMEELEADLAAGNLDQDRYNAARHDLERELLLDVDEAPADTAAAPRSGRWAAAALAVTVPALAVSLYLALGEQESIARADAPPPRAQAQEQAKDLPPMDVLVAKLAERMEQNPDNLEGWIMLGRSYLAIEEAAKAVESFERARSMAPEEPEVLLGLAEALTRAQGSLEGRPAELIDQVLQIAPGHPNGLWMRGLVEFQREDYAKAIDIWTRLEATLPAGSEDAETIAGYLAEARSRGGLAPAPAQAPPPPAVAAAEPVQAPAASAPAQAGTAAKVTVEVSLAPALAARAAPDDALFVFARALQGPPMPLAAKRLQVKDLPATITLDDSMAMMPQMRLSSFPQVVVGARVSKTGNAMPASGDLQGEVSPVATGAGETVQVVIDNLRP